MCLNIQLSQQQIKDFATSFLLTDIKSVISSHQKEIDEIMKEEQKEKCKYFKSFATVNALDKTYNKCKKYNTNFFIIWQEYIEEQKETGGI